MKKKKVQLVEVLRLCWAPSCSHRGRCAEWRFQPRLACFFAAEQPIGIESECRTNQSQRREALRALRAIIRPQSNYQNDGTLEFAFLKNKKRERIKPQIRVSTILKWCERWIHFAGELSWGHDGGTWDLQMHVCHVMMRLCCVLKVTFCKNLVVWYSVAIVSLNLNCAEMQELNSD